MTNTRFQPRLDTIRRVGPVAAGLLLACLGLLSPADVSAAGACDPVALAIGSSIEGSVDAGDCDEESDDEPRVYDVFSFEGQAGQEISFALSTAVDLEVFLLLPGGRILRSSATGFTAVLPVAGTYVVKVGGWYPSGAYVLSTSLSRTCPVVSIAFGDLLPGALSVDDCPAPSPAPIFGPSGLRADVFEFTGTAGQVVSIEMNSTAFDTYLYLFGPGGDLLRENDDDLGNGTNSRIEFQLESSGTFHVWATSYTAAALGDYEIGLDVSEACSYEPIAVGQAIDAVLAPPACPGVSSVLADYYEFDANEDGQVRVRFVSTAFAGAVRLLDPSGAELVSVRTDRSREVAFDRRIEVSGTHRIVVNAAKAGAGGAYRLELGELSCSTSTIEFGGTATGELSPDDCLSAFGPRWRMTRAERHVFSGVAGRRVFVRQAGPFSYGYDYSFLHVTGPDGARLAGARRSVMLTLPVSGDHVIESTSEYSSYLGAYSLELKECGSEPIAFGQTIERVLSSDDCPSAVNGDSSHAFTHTFEGTAGQRVLVRTSTQRFRPVLVLLGPDGKRVAGESEIGDATTRTIVAELPVTGTYAIEASSDPYVYPPITTGPYSLTLLDLGPDLFFEDDFETGDLARWSAAATKGGKLGVAAAAARSGSFGLRFDVAALPPPASKAKLWVKDTSPTAETRYRARFFLNLNDLTVPSDPRTLRLVAGRTAADPSARPFEVRLLYQDGIWQAFGIARDDSGESASRTASLPIPREWVQVVIDWKAASGPGASDGFLVLAVDGQIAGVGNLRNDLVRIDGIQLGLLGGVGLASTGTMFVDDFESRREGAFSSPYGPPTAAFTGGASTTLAD